MTLKSSWIVLLSFTISAFIKKIHFIFFQKVNWKNLSRKTITGKRIRSSHLQPCIIAKFIPQNRGNQTWPTPRGQTSNKGDATDTDLWHSWMFRCLFNFPSSRKQVAAHTKAHVDGEPSHLHPSPASQNLTPFCYTQPPCCTGYSTTFSTTSSSTRAKIGERAEVWGIQRKRRLKETTSSATNLLKTCSEAGHLGPCHQAPTQPTFSPAML